MVSGHVVIVIANVVVVVVVVIAGIAIGAGLVELRHVARGGRRLA